MDCRINESSWKHIYSFLKECKGIHTSSEDSLRKFIEAIYFITRTGCQWRLLPKEYGRWRSNHQRFKRWKDKNIWEKLMLNLSEPDLEYVMIDSTVVRSHACSAGYKKDTKKEEALGRSTGGFSTKIHIISDALGHPLKYILTSGERHDITEAKNLLENIECNKLLADRGYCSQALRSYVEDMQGEVVIPNKSNHKVKQRYDKHLYKERHLIECWIGKLKHFRRIFSRYEKQASSYLAFIQFASSLILLR